MTDPSREVDFDAFGPPTEPAKPIMQSEVIPGVTLDDVLADVVRHHEEVMPAEPKPAVAKPEGPQPLAVIWSSDRPGHGHVVTPIGWSENGPEFRCICEAALLGNRECWAIKRTREMMLA